MPPGFRAEDENGLATSEPRRRCAWMHHGRSLLDRRIQGCGATLRARTRAPLGSSPCPNRSSLACGAALLKTAARRLRRWPSASLDQRRPPRPAKVAGRDEETAPVEPRNKSTKAKIPLDNDEPIQGANVPNPKCELGTRLWRRTAPVIRHR